MWGMRLCGGHDEARDGENSLGNVVAEEVGLTPSIDVDEYERGAAVVVREGAHEGDALLRSLPGKSTWLPLTPFTAAAYHADTSPSQQLQSGVETASNDDAHLDTVRDVESDFNRGAGRGRRVDRGAGRSMRGGVDRGADTGVEEGTGSAHVGAHIGAEDDASGGVDELRMGDRMGPNDPTATIALEMQPIERPASVRCAGVPPASNVRCAGVPPAIARDGSAPSDLATRCGIASSVVVSSSSSSSRRRALGAQLVSPAPTWTPSVEGASGEQLVWSHIPWRVSRRVSPAPPPKSIHRPAPVPEPIPARVPTCARAYFHVHLHVRLYLDPPIPLHDFDLRPSTSFPPYTLSIPPPPHPHPQPHIHLHTHTHFHLHTRSRARRAKGGHHHSVALST